VGCPAKDASGASNGLSGSFVLPTLADGGSDMRRQNVGEGMQDGIEVHDVSIDPFDCSLADEVRWPEQQAAWCCVHKSRGCSTTPPNSLEAPLATAIADVHVQLVATTTSSRADAFDCDSDWQHWESEWAHEKKVWCCKHESRGCPFKTTLGPTTQRAREAYDCVIWWPNYEKTWSPQKLSWCCKEKNRGCTLLARNSQKLATALERISKSGPGLEARPDSRKPYRCTEETPGSSTWALGRRMDPVYFDNWPAEKRAWCCQHKFRGCTTSSFTTTRAPPGYDCYSTFWGKLVSWDEEKKAWCCKHERKGCEGDDSVLVGFKKLFAETHDDMLVAHTRAAIANHTLVFSLFGICASAVLVLAMVLALARAAARARVEDVATGLLSSDLESSDVAE